MLRQRKRSVLLIAIIMALSVTLGALWGVATAGEPAAIHLELVEIGDERTVELTVVDGEQGPVGYAWVNLYSRTTFGKLLLGEGTSDDAGKVSVALPPDLKIRELVAETWTTKGTVRDGLVLASAPSRELEVRPGKRELAKLGAVQPGFISPYPFAGLVLFFLAVYGSVWTTYGFVVSLMGRIYREGVREKGLRR